MDLPKTLDLPIVDILWVDSVQGAWWNDRDNEKTSDMLCRSVCFKVHEDDLSVTVSGHLSSLDSCSGRMKIPKAAIVSLQEIYFV